MIAGARALGRARIVRNRCGRAQQVHLCGLVIAVELFPASNPFAAVAAMLTMFNAAMLSRLTVSVSAPVICVTLVSS